MVLKFIGSGSAFNTKLGNNSAYYKEGNQLLLIDCGSNIFQRIKENNLLDGIEYIHVLVTHTHADHVGSLADLILYTYYSHGEFAKPKVSVYYSDGVEIEKLLKINGVTHDHYYLNYLKSDIQHNIQFAQVVFEKSVHVDEIPSYSLNLIIENNIIHYSGDSSELKSVLNHYTVINECYDYIYIDTCKADYEGNVHLSLRKLTELILPEHRNKVWCMHLDEGFIREEAEGLGFNVVINEF